MQQIRHNSGAIEFVPENNEERTQRKNLKKLRGKHAGKKADDLSVPEIKELVFAIAKHLKII